MILACESKKNALLESPTGTGKTLALLCAAFGWMRSEHKVNKDHKENIPRLIYCSRTHSQLNQVISELKNCAYTPKMVLIGSRDQLCVNPKFKEYKGVVLNSQCKKARQSTAAYTGCSYYKKLITKKNNNEIPFEVFDIEDLHKLGNESKICPYYLQKQRVAEADLVLMPYNYLIDSRIRGTFKIDYANSIIIFDEAHNVGRVSEDVSSFEININHLKAVLGELNLLGKNMEDKADIKDFTSEPGMVESLKTLINRLKDRIVQFRLNQADRIKASKYNPC